MTETNEQAFAVERPWGWRDKLRWRLFPMEPMGFRESDEGPQEAKGVVQTKVGCFLDWKDRLRVLVTGVVRVDVRVYTAEEVTTLHSVSRVSCVTKQQVL